MCFKSEAEAPQFTIQNVWLRDLVEVTMKVSQHFNILKAHKDFFTFSDDDIQQVYDQW